MTCISDGQNQCRARSEKRLRGLRWGTRIRRVAAGLQPIFREFLFNACINDLVHDGFDVLSGLRYRISIFVSIDELRELRISW